MMKKYIIVAFLALLIVFSGCAKKEESNVLTSAFYGGSDGVSVEFKQIAPPDQFDQGEEVPVSVILTNKGEYDIISGNAKAEIYGINLDTFNLPEGYKGTNGILRGKGEFNLDGGEREVSFGNLRYNEEIINSRDFVIRSRVCYPYQTKTDIPICVKSSLSQETGESVCSIDGEKVVAGTVSSAPIQVTSVIERTRGSNQIRFDIKIENKGVGNVYSNDVTCEDLGDGIVSLNNKDKILLEVINPTGVVCGFRSGEDSDKGIIELEGNTRIISCWMEAEDTYTDTLRLILSYMYTGTTSKSVTIFEK
jgi:hypothetical protein